MIVTFIKTMQTRIIGQPRRKGKAQQRKVDGFVYSFIISGIKRHDMMTNDVEDICTESLSKAFKLNAEEVKDMEISLDIASEKYALRFTAVNEEVLELKEDAYAVDVQWSVEAIDGREAFWAKQKPLQYMSNPKYAVELNVFSINLAEALKDEVKKEDNENTEEKGQ